MQRSPIPTTQGSFPSPGLKRSRDGELPELKHPPLPDLTADLVLQVYTHKSLRRPGASKSEEYNDNERLALLGGEVLTTSVSMYLFELRPMLMFEEMETRREKLMSNKTIEAWVNAYEMRKRIRCPEKVRAQLDTPEEGRNVFCAYVGAVYSHFGQKAVNGWIHMLIKYHEQQSSSGDVMMENPPAKKIKNEILYSPSLIPFAARSSSVMSSSTQSSQTYSSPSLSPSPSQSPQTYSPTSPYLNTSQSYSGVPARQIPPHMNNAGTQQPFQTFSSLLKSLQPLLQQQSAQSMGDQAGAKRPIPVGARSTHRTVPFPPSKPNPLAPATPNAPFLPMFNQTAAQRGVKVEYPAYFDGPAHARVWTARCVVNGITKGEGKGGSKQVAKEEAARQAYYAMGWT